MVTKTELAARVAELESDLRQRDIKIKELRDDIDEQRHLVGEMREHLEDGQTLMDEWKEAFRMEEGDNGQLHWTSSPSDINDDYAKLIVKHNKLATPRRY